MYIFSVLNRYITRQYLFWVLAILCVFSCVVGIFEVIELTRRAMGKPDVTFTVILEIMLLRLPFHVQKLLPFIVLGGGLVGLWRINSQQEVIAIRSVGLSIWQFMSGILVATLLLGAVNLLFINPLSAVMNKRAMTMEERYFKRMTRAMTLSEQGIWLREENDEGASIIKARRFDVKERRFEDLVFYDFDHHGVLLRRIDMQQAILKDSYWYAETAYVYHIDGAMESLSLRKPTKMTMQKIQEGYAQPDNLSFWELPGFIDMLKKSGLSYRKYSLYWHAMVAKILMLLAMVMFAGAFALHPTRYRKTAVLIFSAIILGFIIHFTSDVIFALGLGQKLPIALAAWFPSIIALLGSLSLLLHVEVS